MANYSKITAPLTALTRKDKVFQWGPQESKAFEELRRRITSAPILQMLDPQKPIIVETDASDYAMGAQIGQKDDNGKLHPVAFYSRKLTPAELNYDIYNKELLAIVASFDKWEHYL